MKPIDPIFDFLAVTWDAAAQEAAFDGRCFCMISDGRFVNRQAMPDETPHRDPYELNEAFLKRFSVEVQALG